MKSYTTFNILFAACLFVVAQYASADEWVWPTFKATEAEKGVVDIKSTYKYREQVASDNTYLPVLKKAYALDKNPENSLISRLSAVRRADYDLWLKMWTPDSRKLALGFYKSKGLDKDYWTQIWERQFARSKIQLIRKVEYAQYVIFTYKVFSETGKDIGNGLEFPIVFKRDDDLGWGVTLDLRDNPLVIYSPWVEGISQKIVSN